MKRQIVNTTIWICSFANPPSLRVELQRSQNNHYVGNTSNSDRQNSFPSSPLQAVSKYRLKEFQSAKVYFSENIPYSDSELYCIFPLFNWFSIKSSSRDGKWIKIYIINSIKKSNEP